MDRFITFAGPECGLDIVTYPHSVVRGTIELHVYICRGSQCQVLGICSFCVHLRRLAVLNDSFTLSVTPLAIVPNVTTQTIKLESEPSCLNTTPKKS